ncbi:MAG: hypothetical protein FRX49_11215 [Trebouxia sp. A1-2]|nr:MAG: hypothetical protein FRX49_11215 [Trebouxia sp. A1-2]
MQLPVPQFFTEWISSLPKVNGKSHLPREHFASGVSMPTCFAKGCGQTHAWTRCPTLAHTIWDSRSTQPWPVYVYTDVPSVAHAACEQGPPTHSLQGAAVISAAAYPKPTPSTERLAMLFEGDFQGDAAQLEAPVLLDSGASSNFVSPRLLRQLAIT